VNWTASTDNTAVTSYDVYIDGALNGAATGINYTVLGLTISTDYSVRVLAKDSANNQSAQSTAVTATTTNGVNSVVELFFSEYVEGVGNNKALEIVNLTDNPINLSGYSIKKQSNGAGGWINALPLNGTIDVNDVFVMIHFQADDATLVAEADLVAPEGSNYGAPVNFNGNDAVGLFKNDVLIDIIGVLGETTKNFESMTLRRKLTITTPNITYIASEWDQYAFNTFEGIGTYNATAGLNSSVFNAFKIYPNPTYGNTVYFKVGAKTKIKAYNVLGKLVQTAIIDSNNKSMDITTLAKGIYILRVQTANEFITQKLIKR
jgi:predicted extracellular nuclease